MNKAALDEINRPMDQDEANAEVRVIVQTKKLLNRSDEIQGMPTALRSALDIDHSIESHGCPDKRAFMDIARECGMREAIVWRDAGFAKAQV